MDQDFSTSAYLLIQKGPLVGKRVELWKDCTTIGRSRECDIFLEDITVHRKQARILRLPEGFVVRDDHGSGDSFVNDQPTQEQLLSNGDELKFGHTQMVFYDSEGTRPFKLASSRGRESLIGKEPDSQPVSAAYLYPSGGQSSMRQLEVVSNMTIGRSRECDIFLEDLAVSRHHASIHEVAGGMYELIDQRSATGTYINGRRIMQQVLRDGDIVQIGSIRFTFRQVNPS
ncbi:hypothetical protein KSC_048560 [Ktedonobacter sp. SOSP1-52]|uniref:FHA domain-containing protein n=1 Tax=Ktedonobacter sp. SOSP1-52 TaxID=2778366 RepID=UPI00191612AC|nr:FHA domain-containing protein [Ktedonobacter sp. SOSP1-52]GHO65964.1 hypothetical protein KSC_048560 [Ktedonobacter sp. SOSP1-52]